VKGRLTSSHLVQCRQTLEAAESSLLRRVPEGYAALLDGSGAIKPGIGGRDSGDKSFAKALNMAGGSDDGGFRRLVEAFIKEKAWGESTPKTFKEVYKGVRKSVGQVQTEKIYISLFPPDNLPSLEPLPHPLDAEHVLFVDTAGSGLANPHGNQDKLIGNQMKRVRVSSFSAGTLLPEWLTEDEFCS